MYTYHQYKTINPLLNKKGMQLHTTEKFNVSRGVFCMGAMGDLAPTIMKNRLLAPAIFGHFSAVKKKFRVLNKNHYIIY